MPGLLRCPHPTTVIHFGTAVQVFPMAFAVSLCQSVAGLIRVTARFSSLGLLSPTSSLATVARIVFLLHRAQRQKRFPLVVHLRLLRSFTARFNWFRPCGPKSPRGCNEVYEQMLVACIEPGRSSRIH
jgi:hypothetical protein